MDILEGELEALTGFDKEIRSHALPIWFESLVGVDWTLLHISPVYYGFGVPKGDGSPTIVVPGFLGSDIYLYELYLWLSRIGYTSYLSNIGWNADCLNTLTEKLIATIKKANDETGKKVHLIGHSLGGVLSRSAAVQHPDLVESVITLASPFRGVRSHPGVLEMSERIRKRIFREEKKPNFRIATQDIAIASLSNLCKTVYQKPSNKPRSTQKPTALLIGKIVFQEPKPTTLKLPEHISVWSIIIRSIN